MTKCQNVLKLSWFSISWHNKVKVWIEHFLAHSLKCAITKKTQPSLTFCFWSSRVAPPLPPWPMSGLWNPLCYAITPQVTRCFTFTCHFFTSLNLCVKSHQSYDYSHLKLDSTPVLKIQNKIKSQVTAPQSLYSHFVIVFE